MVSEQEKKGLSSRIDAVKQFFSDVSSELKRVSWPARRDVYVSTGVVLVTVAIVAAYMAIVEWGLHQVFFSGHGLYRLF